MRRAGILRNDGSDEAVKGMVKQLSHALPDFWYHYEFVLGSPTLPISRAASASADIRGVEAHERDGVVSTMWSGPARGTTRQEVGFCLENLFSPYSDWA